MIDLKKAAGQTPSGIELQTSYGSQEQPGDYPYTRGIHPDMYRGRLWTMRQYAGFGTAEESNKRYKYLLSQGTTGLSVAFDLPTQMGFDSDHPMAHGEVGRAGVAIDCIEDMEILLQDIDLSTISTSMTINSTAPILLCLYIAVAERKNIPIKSLSGTIQNDLLKEYIARGTYIYPPKHSLKIVTDVLSYCSEKLPKWNPISISGYHIREAGSTAPQEVAFTLANGFTYVEHALKAGLLIDNFAPRLSFFFNAHNHLLEEVAKYRAARRIWATELQDRFHAKDPRSMKLRFHAQTAGSMLTAQQAENNIVRVTLQALGAILGGTQSLHTNGFDEALALPTQKSASLALRTQQVLAYESGAADVADPFAGSYVIEELTDAVEKAARQYLRTIEEKGGMVACIEEGYIQKEIQDAAYRTQLKMETGEFVQVGTNAFCDSESDQPKLLRMNLELQEKQIARLHRFKSKRNQDASETVLLRLEKAAKEDQNLMPFILEAVKAHTTLGEISDTLRSVYGEYREQPTV